MDWQEATNGKMPVESLMIGRVVGTERAPNTAFHFYFWATPECPIGIGTLVKVQSPTRTVWGVIIEGFGYNDAQSPMFDFLGSDGDPTMKPPTERREIRVYQAAVLRHEPENLAQPVPIAPVYLAEERDVEMSLRMDEIPEERRIPVGIYKSGDLKAPVYVDSDFLLGPEAGHLNVTGTSGLAAKTSAIEFTLLSIFQKFPKKVAALCFNVKGGDLLFLDQPASRPLTEEQLEIYKQLGIEPKPFQRVEFYSPYKNDRVNLATLRTHEQLTANVHPLLWGLREVMRYTEVVMNRDDIDVKADAFLQFLRQRVIDPGFFEFDEAELEAGLPEKVTVTNFAELIAWFNHVLTYIETGKGRGSTWRSYAVETIRKIYNRLSNLTTRFAGLVSESDATFDLPWGDFQDRTIYVIDIANLSQEAQDLIFTRVIVELRERMEQQKLGVDHVVVVVDELNQHAPASGRDSYVSRTLRDICARGRYLGLTLFGAQQFRSQVDKQIVGNCSTSFYGRIEMEELAQGMYQIFDPAVKEKVGALSPGELLVRHPYFTQPIFVSFPPPAVMRGQDGLARFPAAAQEPFERAIWRNLRKLAPQLTYNQVLDAIHARQGEGDLQQEGIVAAMNATLMIRPSADRVLTEFQSRIPQRVKTRAVMPSDQNIPKFVPDDDDDDGEGFGDLLPKGYTPRSEEEL